MMKPLGSAGGRNRLCGGGGGGGGGIDALDGQLRRGQIYLSADAVRLSAAAASVSLSLSLSV